MKQTHYLLLMDKEAKSWANWGSMLSSAAHQLCDVGGAPNLSELQNTNDLSLWKFQSSSWWSPNFESQLLSVAPGSQEEL